MSPERASLERALELLEELRAHTTIRWTKRHLANEVDEFVRKHRSDKPDQA